MVKPSGYWTKERCIEEAKKYTSRVEFEKKNRSACVVSRRNGWFEDCCQHMIRLGSKYKRLIYCFEFPDQAVYIGLTYNSRQRMLNHLNTSTSPVYKHIQQTGYKPIYLELTTYLDVSVASLKEGEILEKYRKEGWNILNVNKTGGLGGMDLIWNKQKCRKEALKYNCRSAFKKGSGGAFNMARKKGWLNELCSHMKTPTKWNLKWTKEKCVQEYLKFKNKTDFKKNCLNAYAAASKNGWLHEIYHEYPLNDKKL